MNPGSTDNASVRVLLGDCLERMAEIPDASVALIACDPPYHRVKSEAWDRQWKTDADYLAWIGRLCVEWRRVLRPNGSLYCFASPRMAARVECKIGETFEVLNSITWAKPGQSYAEKYGPENFRQFVPMCERIIFAEHFGADPYSERCEELRQSIFEPMRAYFVRHATPENMPAIFSALMADGRYSSPESVKAHVDIKMGRNPARWDLCDAPLYVAIQRATGMDRDYSDLRREYRDLQSRYEDLRREYEDLRRPFSVSADVPYTDVWDFATVPHRPGKHICEKPLRLLEHIVRSSSRPGDLVLDCFAGSGVTGEACVNLGRSFLGIERDPKWVDRATRRIAAQAEPPLLFNVSA